MERIVNGPRSDFMGLVSEALKRTFATIRESTPNSAPAIEKTFVDALYANAHGFVGSGHAKMPGHAEKFLGMLGLRSDSPKSTEAQIIETVDRTPPEVTDPYDLSDLAKALQEECSAGDDPEYLLHDFLDEWAESQANSFPFFRKVIIHGTPYGIIGTLKGENGVNVFCMLGHRSVRTVSLTTLARDMISDGGKKVAYFIHMVPWVANTVYEIWWSRLMPDGNYKKIPESKKFFTMGTTDWNVRN